jgi:transcriptional regulator with XRE-family HTH domain
VKQFELANKIGISQSMLHYILNGKRGIGPVTAKKLSKVSRRNAWWWITADLADVFKELERIGGANGQQRRAA